VRTGLAALAALAGLIVVPGAQAASPALETFLLLSPGAPVTAPPPLAPAAAQLQSTSEVKFLGHPSSRELVDVGIGPDGAPAQVTVTQRIELDGTGDYSFVIPAPAARVVAGPGSESQPGLRDVGIVWQGFSDRHRVLSATAALLPSSAAKGLPLQVAFERQGDSTVVRLMDVARRRLAIATGRTKLRQLTTLLAKQRDYYAKSQLVGGPGWYVQGHGGVQQKVDVTASLHVSGAITGDGAPVTVDEQLGGRRPVERSFTIPGSAAPKLRLRVELPEPIDILPTPRDLAHSPDPLHDLQLAVGSVAATAAYRRYLASPDPSGPADASYVYRSASKPIVAAAPAKHGDSDVLTILLVIALGAAGLSGLAVLWARS
jgi:hypothetical protein